MSECRDNPKPMPLRLRRGIKASLAARSAYTTGGVPRRKVFTGPSLPRLKFQDLPDPDEQERGR